MSNQVQTSAACSLVHCRAVLFFSLFLSLFPPMFLGHVTLLADESRFTGDGQLTDRGPEVAAERFLLDLGPVNLNQDGDYEFKFSGLPVVRFNTQLLISMKHYFNVRPRPAADRPSWFDEVSVALRLTKNGHEKAVFEFDGTLSQLTWTNGAPKPNQSALYVRGRNANDTGSLVVTEPNVTYRLSLKVRSNTRKAVPAELVLSGGGWKLDSVNADQRFNGLFANADSNGDKQLSEQEIPSAWKKNWFRFDVDADGFLSRAEARELMASKVSLRGAPTSSFSFPWFWK